MRPQMTNQRNSAERATRKRQAFPLNRSACRASAEPRDHHGADSGNRR
jgi:hypothetical protein